MRALTLLFATLWMPLAQAGEHEAHVHGVAKLMLVQSGAALEIALESPLDNALGFEHAPRTEAERTTLAAVARRLEAVSAVVQLPPAAGCQLVEAHVQMPFMQAAEDHDHKDAAHDPDHKDAHSDIEAAYTLRCSAPAALETVEVRLFDTFSRLQSLRAEAATDGGQGAAELTRTSPRWRLPKRP
jgi:hypothetical protein